VTVGGAAWLGVAMQPSSSPPQANTAISRFVAATEASGTARFTETMAFGNSTPSPLSRTSGVIDFRADASRETAQQWTVRSTSTDAGTTKYSVQRSHRQVITIGNRTYTPSGVPPRRWMESSLPLTAAQMLGFGAWLPEGSRANATFVGDATLRGMRTSLYRFTSSSPSNACPASVRGGIAVEIWVDSQSRLVQSRTTIHFPSVNLNVPAGVAGQPNVVQEIPTSVYTVQFSDFGTPVHITRPPVRPTRTSAPLLGDEPQSITGKTNVSNGCDEHQVTLRVTQGH
jgi:hypothetical protein